MPCGLINTKSFPETMQRYIFNEKLMHQAYAPDRYCPILPHFNEVDVY